MIGSDGTDGAGLGLLRRDAAGLLERYDAGRRVATTVWPRVFKRFPDLLLDGGRELGLVHKRVLSADETEMALLADYALYALLRGGRNGVMRFRADAAAMAGLDPAEEAMADGMVAAVYSYHRVLDLEPGVGGLLRDLVSGREAAIVDRALSRMGGEVLGRVFAARLVRWQGVTMTTGAVLLADSALLDGYLARLIARERKRLEAGGQDLSLADQSALNLMTTRRAIRAGIAQRVAYVQAARCLRLDPLNPQIWAAPAGAAGPAAGHGGFHHVQLDAASPPSKGAHQRKRLAQGAPADRPRVLELVEYEIVDEPMEDPAERELPPEDWERLQTLPERLWTDPGAALPEARALAEKYPHVPKASNFATVALQRCGHFVEAQRMAEEAFKRFPDYLFAVTAYVLLCVHAGRLDKAEAILAGRYALHQFYPGRRRFHLSEVVAFFSMMAQFQHASGDDEAARGSLKMLDHAAPHHPTTQQIKALLAQPASRRGP